MTGPRAPLDRVHGEETGSMDSMLDSIADTLEFESEIAINRMVTYIEPAMIVFMAVIVGFVMISVLMPIYGTPSLDVDPITKADQGLVRVFLHVYMGCGLLMPAAFAKMDDALTA